MSVSNYDNIKQLRDSILDQTKDDSELICIMQEHCIAVDSYVHDRNLWVPLIFMCMRFKERQGFVKFLLKQGANVKLQPDGNDNILFACHPCYLSYLISAGCKVKAEETELYILRHLRGGSVGRIQKLINLGALMTGDMDALIAAHPNIMMELVENMIKYLFYAFNIRTDVEDKKVELTSTIARMTESLSFVMSYGAEADMEFNKYCCSNYLYEFIIMTAAAAASRGIGNTINYDVQYHQYMDGELVSSLRPLLNDYRYVKTCEACNVKPDDEVYQMLNIRVRH
jgi:hypothetical protein